LDNNNNDKIITRLSILLLAHRQLEYAKFYILSRCCARNFTFKALLSLDVEQTKPDEITIHDGGSLILVSRSVFIMTTITAHGGNSYHDAQFSHFTFHDNNYRPFMTDHENTCIPFTTYVRITYAFDPLFLHRRTITSVRGAWGAFSNENFLKSSRLFELIFTAYSNLFLHRPRATISVEKLGFKSLNSKGVQENSMLMMLPRVWNRQKFSVLCSRSISCERKFHFSQLWKNAIESYNHNHSCAMNHISHTQFLIMILLSLRTQSLFNFPTRQICLQKRRGQFDWLATNADNTITQSNSLLLVSTKKLGQVENGLRTSWRKDI
jgi:hypothetical protein